MVLNNENKTQFTEKNRSNELKDLPQKMMSTGAEIGPCPNLGAKKSELHMLKELIPSLPQKPICFIHKDHLTASRNMSLF